MMADGETARVRACLGGFRWHGLECRPYKEEGDAAFRNISRQILFDEPAQDCELRYFEMGAGGYSSLERHQHTHAVIVLRGRGQCLLGTTVRKVATFDLVTIPAWTWHQFRATDAEPFGFLCMVNRVRDRPQLPSESDLAALKSFPEVAAFLSS